MAHLVLKVPAHPKALLADAHGLAMGGGTQRAQYGLIQEYRLNRIVEPYIIQDIFFKP